MSVAILPQHDFWRMTGILSCGWPIVYSPQSLSNFRNCVAVYISVHSFCKPTSEQPLGQPEVTGLENKKLLAAAGPHPKWVPSLLRLWSPTGTNPAVMHSTSGPAAFYQVVIATVKALSKLRYWGGGGLVARYQSLLS